jgi:hypothetical protein
MFILIFLHGGQVWVEGGGAEGGGKRERMKRKISQTRREVMR